MDCLKNLRVMPTKSGRVARLLESRLLFLMFFHAYPHFSAADCGKVDFLGAAKSNYVYICATEKILELKTYISMKKSAACLLFCLCIAQTAFADSAKNGLKVIPKPIYMVESGAVAHISPSTKLRIAAPKEDKAALKDYAKAALNELPEIKGANNSRLALETVASSALFSKAEGYAIEVSGGDIKVSAKTGAGLFYGLQTLLQMERNGGIKAAVVADEPRFGYRGMMLDVSRHFFDKAFVKKQIDAMAHYKLNRLHLHLTDAAGWRIEIKKYPRLTQFAAWRPEATWKAWGENGARYCDEGTPGAYGGYFTQNDIRELVEYAKKRYITIVPEIEMPAHSDEVMTAYPELSCTHEPYKQSDFCVGSEDTFTFLENVLTEVMELFPSEYIHIGGDEAGKQSWPSCPLCQKRMKEENLQNVDELQSYLIHRIERFLNSHGRKLLGWDEILDGGLAPNATVMSWRGTEGGLKAIRAGHKAIMTPGEFCYFDSYQDAPNSQVEAIGGYLPLKKVYSYNPVPDSLTKQEADLMCGVQANLWAEYIPTPEHMEMMIYPRLLALSEVAWSLPVVKDYDEFRGRALDEVEYLRSCGYSPFDLKNEIGDRKESLTPIDHLAVGKKVAYAPDAMYYPTYTAGGDQALVDGRRGGWTYGDHLWQGFISKGGVDVVIDMEKPTQLTSISADFMQICGPGVFLPAEVIISVSDDGKEYTELARIEHEVVKDSKVGFKNFGWQGSATARYIRYKADYGQFGGFLFTDEIVVK